MEIKDYITKNLINLNWNILPQIFEENDVELTEEIEAYLRNTPENTNWNIFDGMSESEETFELPHKIYFLNSSSNAFDTTQTSLKTEQDIINWVNEYEGQNIEFYSSEGGLMSFGGYQSNGYLWTVSDSTGEFVWVYSNSMDHYYDN